jgi:hypothetical protein
MLETPEHLFQNRERKRPADDFFTARNRDGKGAAVQ